MLGFLLRPDLAVGGWLVGWLAGGLVDDDDSWWPRGVWGWLAALVAVAGIVAWALVSLARAGVFQKGSLFYTVAETLSNAVARVLEEVAGLIRPVVNLLPGVAL